MTKSRPGDSRLAPNKNTNQRKAPLGASLVVLSSFFYASYGIWTKLMGNFFGGYTASALRSVLVLLILLPIALFCGQLRGVQLRRNWAYLLGMVVVSLFTWGPLYYAILHAGIGISLAVNYASIVLGMFVFGWLFGREQFTKDKWLSCALGIAGLGLVFMQTSHDVTLLALAAALVSGLSVAANMVLSKHIPYNATQSTVALWTTSVIANTLMALLFERTHLTAGWHIEWAYLVAFAVASVIASWCFIKGLKLIESGAAGVLGLLEIVFGVLFGVLLFHERPGVTALLGVMIILAAAAIPYMRELQKK